MDSITPYRLDKIVKAAKMHADPDGARAEADEKARERGVCVGRSDEHGNKTIYIRASSGAVTRFDATITEHRRRPEDPRRHPPCPDHRRADAIEIIADPRYTDELLLQAHATLPPTHPTPRH